MWFKEYRDYKIDAPLKKETINQGNGITGCEMHELNGWGEIYHRTQSHKKPGIFSAMLHSLFGWFDSSHEEKS